MPDAQRTTEDPRSTYRPAPKPPGEAARLQAIARYKLEGIGREQPFDHITQFAADLFAVPISLVSIVGSQDQCFRGACGMDASGTSRDVAFCAFAILGSDVMVVPDATQDPCFRDNPLVRGDPFVRFYAGAPLRMADGEAVGTLCLIDSVPRPFGPQEQRRLAQLARTVVDLIELRVERFAAEEQRQRLAQERALLKLTVENVSEAVALVDADLRLDLWNQAFLDLFDYPEPMVVHGASAAELIRLTAQRGELGPGDPDQIVAAFVHSIRGSGSRQLEIPRSDGKILDVRRKSIPGGRFILTARDITDERKIARLKDELVSTVSHELRTPLTAISGALGLMASGNAGELPAKSAGLVKIGQKNADRLIALVNDLLDMDKIESGKFAFAFEQADLRQILADVIEQNHPYAQRMGVTLALEAPDAPLIARVDPPRMMQVVTNLVSNAAKFSPHGSEVRVALSARGDTARISVTDQGPGVSAEFRERLFSRFAQESGTHQQGHSGTGLGLAISKNIVDAHGGTIALAPDGDARDSGTGATFYVDLPIAAQEGRAHG